MYVKDHPGSSMAGNLTFTHSVVQVSVTGLAGHVARSMTAVLAKKAIDRAS